MLLRVAAPWLRVSAQHAGEAGQAGEAQQVAEAEQGKDAAPAPVAAGQGETAAQAEDRMSRISAGLALTEYSATTVLTL